MVFPSYSHRFFYALMGKYGKINTYMGNVDVGSEYLPIPKKSLYSKSIEESSWLSG